MTAALIPLSQIGKIEVRAEDPILRRRDRTPTITVQSDIDESLQPPQVSMEIGQALAPLIAQLPPATASKPAAISRTPARPTRLSPRCSRS